MYEDENITYKIGINWKDIIIKVIILILILLLLIWLFPKADLDVFYDSVYNNNIKTMKESARNYYIKDRLPNNVGDSTSMNLKEMIDNHMLIRFTDKDKNYCDETTSRVEVTKTSETTYVLKVQLNCGDQKDYILETIGCNDVCPNGDCTIVQNPNNGSNNNGTTNNGSGSSSSNENTDNNDVNVDIKNPGSDVYTKTITYYQHRQAIVSNKVTYVCPDGYKKDGTKCYSETIGATIDATPIIGPDQVITTEPKISVGEEHKEYKDAIKTKVNTEYQCPEGYTPNGAYCIKYAKAIEVTGQTTYTCPDSSYNLEGTTCRKVYPATPSTGNGNYTCPNGGNVEGSNCVLTTSKVAKTDYVCPDGYTPNGSGCYRTYTPSNNVTYKCNEGKVSGNKCVITKTIDATPKTTYGNWVNKGTKYYTTGNKAYTGDTAKLVYIGKITGAACGAPCGNKGIWYKYSYYERSKNTTYSCSQGTQSGNKCVITTYKDATPVNNYTCPNGGSLQNGVCIVYADKVPKTRYECPSGYNEEGGVCKKRYAATYIPGNTVYTCPNGGYPDNGQCIITTPATPKTGETTYTCPSGYNYNKTTGQCEYKIDATAKDIYSYSCPSGYTEEGSGENLRCYKIVKNSGVQYCEDTEAKLINGKCVKTVKGTITGYTCPSTDYTLDGSKCTKKSTVVIDATEKNESSTTYKYQWSTSSSIDGWEFTGKTKTETKTYTAYQK